MLVRARTVGGLLGRAATRAVKVNVPAMTTSVRTVVTLEDAKKMAKNYNEIPNDVLLNMAVMGDQDAREERLIREIMSVENISWEEAQPIFDKMVESNRKGLFVATLPYKIGIAAALVAGFGSLPMIFDINTVLWFNEIYVTSDVPEAKDLETPLEVGSFAWNWMEPPLGYISFFLLCMQYSRSQMENLGVKPYTYWFKHRRAERLCSEFPKYNSTVVYSFSEGDSLSGGDVHATNGPVGVTCSKLTDQMGHRKWAKYVVEPQQ